MNKNEKFVITINRELGSGGRPVAMNTLWPLALACVRANIVDGGIS